MNASDIVAILSGLGTMFTAIYVGINTYRDRTAERHRKSEEASNKLLLADYIASVEFNKKAVFDARAETDAVKKELRETVEGMSLKYNSIIEKLQQESANEKLQIQNERHTSATLRDQILLEQRKHMELVNELKANDFKNINRITELELRVDELEKREIAKNAEIAHLESEITILEAKLKDCQNGK